MINQRRKGGTAPDPGSDLGRTDDLPDVRVGEGEVSNPGDVQSGTTHPPQSAERV